MALWLGLVVYCFIAEGAIIFSKSNPARARRLASVWPHDTFIPSAVACAGELFVVGDGFEVHGVRLSQESGALTIPKKVEMELLLSAEDIGAPWVSFDLACGLSVRGRCDELLLLEQGGRRIMQVPLNVQPGSVVNHWSLVPSLPWSIITFVTVDGARASRHCKRGNGTVNWALIVATDRGDSVALCPRGSQLHPSRRVSASWPHPHHHDVGGDLIGLHVDGLGHFWRVTHAISGEYGSCTGGNSPSGVLHASGATGRYHGRWSLPSSRTWAHGICGLPTGKGFIMAAMHSSIGQPELWYIDAGLPNSLVKPTVSDKSEESSGKLEDMVYSTVV